MHNPGKKHMDVVIQILRYIKVAHIKRLLFMKNSNYKDVIQMKQVLLDDRISTSGYFTFVRCNLVTWKNMK